jgi:hypothetical protein
MATYVAGIGWIGDDAEQAKAATATPETAKSLGTTLSGAPAFGADIFQKATPGQYGGLVNGINPDPRYPTGSPEWLAYYAPEYLSPEGDPYRLGGAEVVYGDTTGTGEGVTIRGRKPTGILQSPWSGVTPGMSEEEIRKWVDLF